MPLKKQNIKANLVDPQYLGKHLNEEDIVDACEFVSSSELSTQMEFPKVT